MFAKLCLCLFITAVNCRVIINNNIEYFQKNPTVINGEEFDSDIKIVTLHFPRKGSEIGNINIITNFPHLQGLYIDRYSLTKLPILANLPNLKLLSLAKNELSTINNASLATLYVEVINLFGNKINTINKNAFGPTTTELYLTCNEISEISSNWFTNPEFLILLHLGGNRIKTLPAYIFEHFINLQRLELRNNHLHILEHNALVGPRRWTFLHFGYNNISEITPEVFGVSLNLKIVHIKYLDVQNNLLSYLKDELLNKIIVDNLRISGNPWQCACRDRIVDWWKGQNSSESIDDKDDICYTAESFKNACVPVYEQQIIDKFKKYNRPYVAKIC